MRNPHWEEVPQDSETSVSRFWIIWPQTAAIFEILSYSIVNEACKLKDKYSRGFRHNTHSNSAISKSQVKWIERLGSIVRLAMQCWHSELHWPCRDLTFYGGFCNTLRSNSSILRIMPKYAMQKNSSLFVYPVVM